MGGVTQEQLRLFLTGRITQEVAHALSPRIKELRAASGDPITLYIDSPGGSSAVAEGIRFLIKAQDQDRKKMPINYCRDRDVRLHKEDDWLLSRTGMREV